LIIEDEEDIQQLVSYNLIKAGFNARCAESGEEGLKQVGRERPDIILLDLMLPGMSGLEVIRALHAGPETAAIPVIMLTAKSEETDMIAGLDAGADDYISKPFSNKILIARIKAVLRRRAAASPEKDEQEGLLVLDGLTIDPGRHEVTVAGEPVSLTLTEFGILRLLAGRPGWVYTRQQIIEAVRGYGYLVTPRAVDVQVFGLRKKLGDLGERIETVRGLGYRYNP